MTEAWLLTDGRAGNLRQARALAHACGIDGGEITVQMRPPWSILAPRLAGPPGLALRKATAAMLQPPWPRLAIGCGRRAAWATRWLRRASGGQCRCVQILAPGVDPAHWDLVITPRHDRLSGDNVLQTTGSLNPVDSAWLAAARADFPQLAELPSPRLTVLLGGPRRGVPMDAASIDDLIAGLRRRHHAEGGSILVTASPRSPAPLAERLRHGLADLPGLAWMNAGDGPNPYPGMLAWADRVVVTADSVNMLSEAAASGAPVHTLLPDSPLPARLARFHEALRAGGWLHDLDAPGAVPASPLRETDRVAREMLAWLRKAGNG